MVRQLMLVIVLSLFMTACSTSDPVAPADPDYLGAWTPIPHSMDTDLAAYKRIPALDGDRPGIEFRADGTATRRTHGWCGTPPLTYYNLAGVWEELADGMVLTKIDEGYGSGRIRWEIVSIEGDLMRCRLTYEEGS